MHSLVSSMCHLCGVCGVCCMSLNSPVSLCVAARCVSCVPPFSLVSLPLFTYVDTRALCEAALSLKKLNLTVISVTCEALAVIFDLQSLNELALKHRFDFIAKVSSACSSGTYVRMYVCSYSCEVWTLKEQFT